MRWIMMLNQIDRLLHGWAEWRIKSASHGLGYKMSSLNMAMADKVQGGGSLDMALPPDVDPDAEYTLLDSAVMQLPKVLQLVVNEWYCQPGTNQQKARALGVKVDTLKKYLGDAQASVARVYDESREGRKRGLQACGNFC